MSWTIYKSGQGYWTRLLSGLAGGILVLAAAAWMWNVIESFNLEWTSKQDLTVPAQKAGDDVLASYGLKDITESPVGDNGAKKLIVAKVTPGSAASAAGLQPRDVITAAGGKPVNSLADLRTALASANAGSVVIHINRGVAIGLFIAAGLASIIIIVFGVMLFKWCGVKPNTSDFLIATEGEMKKVNWPNKREIVGSTWIVIVALAMFAGILFFSDMAFLYFFRFVHVLDV